VGGIFSIGDGRNAYGVSKENLKGRDHLRDRYKEIIPLRISVGLSMYRL
jgi:hypothetical protein